MKIQKFFLCFFLDLNEADGIANLSFTLLCPLPADWTALLCYLNVGIKQSNTVPREYCDVKKQSKMEAPLSFIVMFLFLLVIRKLQLPFVDKKA